MEEIDSIIGNNSIMASGWFDRRTDTEKLHDAYETINQLNVKIKSLKTKRKLKFKKFKKAVIRK